jgi:hypothetical protein
MSDNKAKVGDILLRVSETSAVVAALTAAIYKVFFEEKQTA